MLDMREKRACEKLLLFEKKKDVQSLKSEVILCKRRVSLKKFTLLIRSSRTEAPHHTHPRVPLLSPDVFLSRHLTAAVVIYIILYVVYACM